MSVTSTIGFQEALNLVLGHAPPIRLEDVSLDHLGGRILGEPILALRDHPPFTASAVDGFAICDADLGRLRYSSIELDLIGTVGPGAGALGLVVAPGQTVKVLTGAPIPGGAASVLMQEQSEVHGSRVKLVGPTESGAHIRVRAEEFRAGDEVVPSGIRAHPGVVAAAAMTGKTNWQVGIPPAVAIVVTGDELISPGVDPGENSVFDSHTYALIAALTKIGIEPTFTARCRDSEREITEAIESALHTASVVLTTGGVSGGERDFVRRAFREIGFDEVFAGVRMKPGRPVVFGVSKTTSPRFVFGLPGNPMAALIAFTVLAKPFLLLASGLEIARPLLLHAVLKTDIRKRIGLTEFVPVLLETETSKMLATPLDGRRSHMFGGLSTANGLAILPEDLDTVEAGSKVTVLQWGA